MHAWSCMHACMHTSFLWKSKCIVHLYGLSSQLSKCSRLQCRAAQSLCKSILKLTFLRPSCNYKETFLLFYSPSCFRAYDRPQYIPTYIYTSMRPYYHKIFAVSCGLYIRVFIHAYIHRSMRPYILTYIHTYLLPTCIPPLHAYIHRYIHRSIHRSSCNSHWDEAEKQECAFNVLEAGPSWQWMLERTDMLNTWDNVIYELQMNYRLFVARFCFDFFEVRKRC